MKIVNAAIIFLFFIGISHAQTKWDKIDFSEAQLKANKENKLILIKFYTDWCVPCKQVDTVIFQNDKEIYDYLNEKYVKLSLNAEKEGSAIAKKYNIGAYPTLLFLDSDGTVLGKVVGTRGRDDYFEAIKTAGKSDVGYLERMKSRNKNKKQG